MKTIFQLGTILSLITNLSFGAVCTPNKTPANWGTSADWDCGRVPDDGDEVEIPTGFTVSFAGNINQSSDNIIIRVNGIMDFPSSGDKIKLGSSSTITLYTGASITGASNSNTITIGSGASEWSGPTALAGPVVISDGVLPIELSYFKINTSQNKIDLTWETKSETNNDYFTIERKNPEGEFKEIGKVKGAGTTSEATKYHWIDENPEIGFDYYRIKQTDFDGKFSYSHVEYAEVEKKTPSNGTKDFLIYPNPSSDGHFSLKIHGFMEEVLIVVRNSTGKEIIEKTIVDVEEGTILTSHDLGTHLPTGIYFIVASSDKNIVNKKLIVK